MTQNTIEDKAKLFSRFICDSYPEEGTMEDLLTKENISRAFGIESNDDWSEFVGLVYQTQPDYATQIAELMGVEVDKNKKPTLDGPQDISQTLDNGDFIDLIGFSSEKVVTGKYLVLDTGDNYGLISEQNCGAHLDLVKGNDYGQGMRDSKIEVIEGGRIKVDHANEEFSIWGLTEHFSKDPGWHSYRLMTEAFPDYRFNENE